MNREVHTAKLVSITPDAEKQIVYMAQGVQPQRTRQTIWRLLHA